MAIEIERKFLVDKRKMHDLSYLSEERIEQGYLSHSPTIRVRIKANRGFLTVKSSTKGLARKEFEYEIPARDAKELLRLCGWQVLKKIRRTIEYGGHIWEIDFFMGRHAGLVLAEVELKSANEFVDLPEWITHEVSGEARYFNSNLVKIDWAHRPWKRG